jgi:hypothetical protein
MWSLLSSCYVVALLFSFLSFQVLLFLMVGGIRVDIISTWFIVLRHLFMPHGYTSTKVISGSCIYLLFAITSTCIINMLKRNICILNFKHSSTFSTFPCFCFWKCLKQVPWDAICISECENVKQLRAIF